MDDLREALIRLKVKRFIWHLRDSNWAEPIPDEWECMDDEELEFAISLLEQSPRVRRREKDWKWEAV